MLYNIDKERFMINMTKEFLILQEQLKFQKILSFSYPDLIRLAEDFTKPLSGKEFDEITNFLYDVGFVEQSDCTKDADTVSSMMFIHENLNHPVHILFVIEPYQRYISVYKTVEGIEDFVQVLYINRISELLMFFRTIAQDEEFMEKLCPSLQYTLENI